MLPQVTPSANEPISAAKGTVKFAISVPKKTASAKRPAYVSPSTQSMKVSIIQGSTSVLSQTVSVTPTSSGCTSSLASTTCTLQLALNAGSYTASITTYDGANGSGSALSTAQAVPFKIVADQTNQVPLTLSGIASKIIVVSADAQSVYVEAQDVDGNFIIGAGAPTFTAAKASGTAVATITQPTSTRPNLISLSPVSPAVVGTETIDITATYPGETNACSQSGAVCTLASAITAAYTGGNVFVANYSNSNVLGFTLPIVSPTQAPAYVIPVSDPYPMTSDVNGNIYVASYSNPAIVSEISPPYNAVAASNSSGGGDPYGIAVAPNGNVFLANTTGSFSVYAPPLNGAAPITNSNSLSQPYGVATDSSNNVYVADETYNAVLLFASPYTGAPTKSVATSSSPYSVLVAGDKLIVGESSDIDVFQLPLTGVPPIATISSGVNSIYNMTVDSSGNLWVANYQGGSNNEGSIEEFTTPWSSSQSPSVSISMPVSGTSSYSPWDLAFDSSGNLYVSNIGGGAQQGGIVEFAKPITSSSSAATAIETNNFYYPYYITTTKPTFVVTP